MTRAEDVVARLDVLDLSPAELRLLLIALAHVLPGTLSRELDWIEAHRAPVLAMPRS